MVTIISESDDSMRVFVSRLPLLKKKNQEVLLEAYNNKTTINVKVTKLVNKGVVADYAGCEIFIPESLLSMGEDVNLNSFIGRDLDVKIIDGVPIKTGHLVHGGTAYKEILLFVAESLNDEIKKQGLEIKQFVQ